jgi:hypothetical protein
MGIILKWRIFTAVIWLRMDPSDDSCEHSSEPPDSVKGGEFYD